MTDQTPRNVLMICFAYEKGYGQYAAGLPNPFGEGTDEWYAYEHGKTEARAADSPRPKSGTV